MGLERPTFTPVRLREGYDMAEVDQLVDRVIAALAGDGLPMAATDVVEAVFTPVRLREGYDMAEVDHWLDRAAAELDARRDQWLGQQADPAEPEMSVEIPPLQPAPTAPGVAVPGPRDGADQVIAEQRGVPVWVWVLIAVAVLGLAWALLQL